MVSFFFCEGDEGSRAALVLTQEFSRFTGYCIVLVLTRS